MINASSLLSPRPYQAPPISAGPVMISIIGRKLSEIEEKHIGHPNTGGIILFKRNFENRAQLCALIQEIRAVRRAAGNGHIIIAADQAGGRVQRFKGDGFTDLPEMSKLGDLYEVDQKRAKDAAKAIGFKGAKFSDALNMKGASPNGESVTQAALKAFQTGCDMVLIDHTKKIIGQLLEELEKLEHKPNQASLDRLSKCLAQDEALDWDKLQKEALYQSSKALIATEFFPDKATEKIAPRSFQRAA